jgi:hypothetical protein
MRVVEDPSHHELVFYSAKALRTTHHAFGVVSISNSIDLVLPAARDACFIVPASVKSNIIIIIIIVIIMKRAPRRAQEGLDDDADDDGGEDDDDDAGGGGALMPVSRAERAAAIEARHAPYSALLQCVSRTLFCWFVLGPIVARAAA